MCIYVVCVTSANQQLKENPRLVLELHTTFLICFQAPRAIEPMQHIKDPIDLQLK